MGATGGDDTGHHGGGLADLEARSAYAVASYCIVGLSGASDRQLGHSDIVRQFLRSTMAGNVAHDGGDFLNGRLRFLRHNLCGRDLFQRRARLLRIAKA